MTMSTLLQQRITAVLLTLFVLGLAASAPIPEPPSVDARTRELTLALRPLALQMALFEQFQDTGLFPSLDVPAPETEGDATAPETEGKTAPPPSLESPTTQLANTISHLVRGPRSPGTDETRVLGAIFLVAFSADDMAREILETLRTPNERARALKDLLAANPTTREGDLRLLEETPGMPTLARLRIVRRVTEVQGRTAALQEIEGQIASAQSQGVSRMMGSMALTGISGLIGMVLLLFVSRLLARLRKTYKGLSGVDVSGGVERARIWMLPAPFQNDPLLVYTVLVGWVAFGLMLGYFTSPDAPFDLASGDLVAALLIYSASSGAFGIFLIHHLCPLVNTAQYPIQITVTSPDDPPVIAAPKGTPIEPSKTLWESLGLTLTPFNGRMGAPLRIGYLAFCLAVPITFLLGTLTQILVGDIPVITHPLITMLSDSETGIKTLLIILVATVLAPLFEELLFRGFLYRALRDRLGVGFAIGLSSMIFATVHPSGYTVLPIFGLSVMLCLLYERTGSIVPSIILHSLHNLSGILVVTATLRDVVA